MIELETMVPQPEELRAQAARCFRLAQGIAGVKLSDELEAIGRDFERQAQLIEAARPAELGGPAL